VVHLSAHVSSVAPKAVHEELHARVRAICAAPDLETARTLLAKVVADDEPQAPTAIAPLERGFDDATAVALPRASRKRLRTTHGPERLTEEVRRRARVLRSFPTRDSAIRLLPSPLDGA
jgi:transposase-like protein